MDFNKSYGLWERECVAGPGGSASQYDNVNDGISSMSRPIGNGSTRHMMHEGCFWTEVTASNDLVEGHSFEGQEYRSIVRVDVSPCGGAPEKLVDLLRDSGFRQII